MGITHNFGSALPGADFPGPSSPTSGKTAEAPGWVWAEGTPGDPRVPPAAIPPHLQEGPGRLLALLLQLLDPGVQPGDLLGQARHVFVLSRGDVALQAPQPGQEVAGQLLQGQAQPLEVRQDSLPLGFGFLLRDGRGGSGAGCPSLDRDPRPRDDLPPLNPSRPAPLRSIYQIFPVSPHFSLPELEEFVSVVLQGLQPSLDLLLRGRKMKISFLWRLGQLQTSSSASPPSPGKHSRSFPLV